MDENNTIYYKRGKKYVPFGMYFDKDKLSDGIWLVRKREHCRSITNVDHLRELVKVGETEMFDIPKLAGIDEYAEYVMNSEDFRKLLNKGATMNDYIHCAVSKVFELSEKLKEK